MISQGLNRTKMFCVYCSIYCLYHVVILIKVLVKLHDMNSFNLSKDNCQPLLQDDTYPVEREHIEGETEPLHVIVPRKQ